MVRIFEGLSFTMRKRNTWIVVATGSILLVVYIAITHLAVLLRTLIVYADLLSGLYADELKSNYFGVLSGFFFLYVLVIVLSLPLAGTMDIVGGFLFGTIGFPMALLSVLLGSIIPFLMAQRLSAATLKRFDLAVILRVQRGFRRNDLQYLILMRLLPWAPFSVTTIIAGALGMPIRRFIAGTFIGFLPFGFALNAIGQGLGRLADFNNLPVMQLYRDPAFLIAVVGIGIIALISLGRRLPFVSRLPD